MKIKLSELFLVCVKVGALLLGGGYVIVPLLVSEFSEKRNWLTREEVIDFYAMGQCIPGIIAPNTIMLAGYKLRGKTGAFCALLGLTLAPFVAILALASFVSILLKSVIMNDIFWGVNVAIIILIILTVKEVWSVSIVDKATFLLFLFAFLACIFGVSPAIIIIIAIIWGFLRIKFIKGEQK